MKKTLLLMIAVLVGSIATAQTSCSIENMQGSYASGFLGWALNQGGMYVKMNPATECGATYPYNITSVDIMIADGSAFGVGTGIGTLTYRVRIHTTGTQTPCALPGTVAGTSGTLSLSLTGEGLNPQTVPVVASVNGPFFVSYEPISWSGIATEIPSVLWDDEPRAVCKQMLTQDNGATWVDHTDFFDLDSDLGFVDVIVNGTFTPGGGGDECLTWVDPSPTTGYSNFNTVFGGAPCNDGEGCPFNEIQDFEVWQSEAYAMNNCVAGGSYTFSHCDGPGAGSWTPDYAIIAPSGAVDASGAGDGDGCSITWTASESGTYLIVINEEGSCGVAGLVDNGFPAITCNGTPNCGPPVECDAGVIADTSPQFVCPDELAIFATDGSEGIPLAPGGYAIVFTPTTGTGGIDDVLTLFGVELPYEFDADLNGVLSFNDLPPFSGEWSISGFAYTDEEDLDGTLCSETADFFLVTFLDASDPLCSGECPEGEILDCNGNCAPIDWIGDGFCDDGTYEYNGNFIFLNCPEFDNDGGDCDISSDCTTWVDPSPTTGWSDFNNAPLTGAPVPVFGECPFIEITEIEVWKSEAYAMDNCVTETCYTFSHCNGPGAGSWVPYYAIYAPSGALVYEGLGDGDGCSVTWIAAEDGTYLIAINEDGNCGVAEAIDNGFPAITCNGTGCTTVSVNEIAETNFNIFPNPNKGQFSITSLGENGTAQVDVLEISGKLIQSKQVNFNDGTRYEMNLGDNANGIYFVRITMNNTVKVHKVVVN